MLHRERHPDLVMNDESSSQSSSCSSFEGTSKSLFSRSSLSPAVSSSPPASSKLISFSFLTNVIKKSYPRKKNFNSKEENETQGFVKNIQDKVSILQLKLQLNEILQITTCDNRIIISFCVRDTPDTETSADCFSPKREKDEKSNSASFKASAAPLLLFSAGGADQYGLQKKCLFPFNHESRFSTTLIISPETGETTPSPDEDNIANFEKFKTTFENEYEELMSLIELGRTVERAHRDRIQIRTKLEEDQLFDKSLPPYFQPL